MEQLTEKFWKVSAPISSVVIILYLVFSFITKLNESNSSSDSSHPRDDYDSRILVIMEKQAIALTQLSQTQQEIQLLIAEQQKILRKLDFETTGVFDLHKDLLQQRRKDARIK